MTLVGSAHSSLDQLPEPIREPSLSQFYLEVPNEQAGEVAFSSALALRSMLDGSRYWTIAVIMVHTPPSTLNHPSPLSISSSGSSW
jgi:hypothetical protein